MNFSSRLPNRLKLALLPEKARLYKKFRSQKSPNRLKLALRPAKAGPPSKTVPVPAKAGLPRVHLSASPHSRSAHLAAAAPATAPCSPRFALLISHWPLLHRPTSAPTRAMLALPRYLLQSLTAARSRSTRPSSPRLSS
jgi:hypothetical protein